MKFRLVAATLAAGCSVAVLAGGCGAGTTAADRRAVSFVRALAAGQNDVAARQLASTDAATSRTLGASWDTYVRQLGALQGLGTVRHGERGGLTVEQVELRMAKGRGLAELSYDRHGVLTGVRLVRWPRGRP